MYGIKKTMFAYIIFTVISFNSIQHHRVKFFTRDISWFYRRAIIFNPVVKLCFVAICIFNRDFYCMDLFIADIDNPVSVTGIIDRTIISRQPGKMLKIMPDKGFGFIIYMTVYATGISIADIVHLKTGNCLLIRVQNSLKNANMIC